MGRRGAVMTAARPLKLGRWYTFAEVEDGLGEWESETGRTYPSTDESGYAYAAAVGAVWVSRGGADARRWKLTRQARPTYSEVSR